MTVLSAVIPVPIERSGGGGISTVGWVILAVWLAGVVLAAYPCYLLLLHGDPTNDPNPDTEDKAMAGLLGFLFAACWPVVLFGWAAFKVSKIITQAILGGGDKEGADR